MHYSDRRRAADERIGSELIGSRAEPEHPVTLTHKVERGEARPPDDD